MPTLYQDKIQDERIKWLEEHYSKFNEEMGHIETSVAVLIESIGNVKKIIDNNNEENKKQHEQLFGAIKSVRNRPGWIITIMGVIFSGIFVSMATYLLTRVK